MHLPILICCLYASRTTPACDCKLQASGDNLLMVVPTFCDRLANDPNATAPIARSDSPSVYFDILAFHMVRHRELRMPLCRENSWSQLLL